jgi:hypothetical protein
MILLPPPPALWEYRHTPPCSAMKFILKAKRFKKISYYMISAPFY